MKFLLVHINQLKYYIGKELKRKTITPDVEAKLLKLQDAVVEMIKICSE